MPDRSGNIAVHAGRTAGGLGQEAEGTLRTELASTVRLVALALCAGLVTAVAVVIRSLV
jgi:hypothetical protein